MVPLEATMLFSHLSADELATLRQAAKERSFAAGQEVFKEGDPGDGVYVVKEGMVQISALVAGVERVVFSRILPGDFFGEMSLIDNQPRSATASAEQPSELYFVPRQAMLDMLHRSPQFWPKLVEVMSHRQRDLNQKYVSKILQADRMEIVGRFASSIVHDLKNPLTIISIVTDLACQDSATPGARRNAERIRKQVERISNLVNDIMEFTRGGTAPLALVATDYATFVNSIIGDLQSEIMVKSVKIKFENPPPPVKLNLHPHRLSRVLYNLIHNAVDVMPGGGEIKMRFQSTDDAVSTEIQDQGPGIAPEILERLFEAFATHGKTKGTGLGLSLSKKIIEDHGGQIYARNAAGGGAIFSFSLPLPKADQAKVKS
jgi:signal transduction histidine kinase